MSDSTFVSIRGVSKRFGSYRAVDDVSVDIAAGEFFSLLGPSGCGKSTLMRMIAGFEQASSGEICIEGQPLGRTPPHRRPVNMVFQNYAIFPHLTVYQNIGFGLRKSGLSTTEKDKRIRESLAMIKLEDYVDRKSHQLSGGQRQRIALARALIRQPKVLLLDEPLGALDKKLREQMQMELRSLQKSLGTTFIFVTHDQEEAMTMSDRVAVMSAGRIQEVGAPADLYERPRTRFVADFLGLMNFVDGVVERVEGETVVVQTSTIGSVEARVSTWSPEENRPVTLAIRPENIILSDAPLASIGNSIQGNINTAAFLGDRSHVHVQIASSNTSLQTIVPNTLGTASRIGSQDHDVWLNWQKEAVILLPA